MIFYTLLQVVGIEYLVLKLLKAIITETVSIVTYHAISKSLLKSFKIMLFPATKFSGYLFK